MADDENGKLKIDLPTIIILVVITLVLIQAFGLIFTSLNINLGPIFLILPIALSGIFAVTIFKKILSNEQVTKEDIFAIMVTTIIALIVLFYLRGLVPEIFTGSFSAMTQSLFGVP